tara:strand:- start:598 stop:834 length:237 start_codon:yes stop_codon:yes gene_type:complete
MKSLKQKCIDLFKNQEIKEDMKEIITPIFEMIYNEIYVYIWVICFYSVFLFLFTVINLFLLLKMINSNRTFLLSRYGE